MALLNRVRCVFADVFQMKVSDIGPDTSPDNVEDWTSIQHLNLVLALEQEFDVQFTPEEIEQLLSVSLIADLLSEKRPELAPAAAAVPEQVEGGLQFA
jgi:acyl carrier protein